MKQTRVEQQNKQEKEPQKAQKLHVDILLHTQESHKNTKPEAVGGNRLPKTEIITQKLYYYQYCLASNLGIFLANPCILN